MERRSSSPSALPAEWNLATLGNFYIENRSSLVNYARHLLGDNFLAEEVVHEALMKFMLAAPEIHSTDHASGYLHRTIRNLCIDTLRANGRRPNLTLAQDQALLDIPAPSHSSDPIEILSTAEDAAIVRQALALLSPAERAALVMWEVEGRSVREIASELGVKESSVRHTIYRARASLRKVLATIVVDESKGLTALDLLSSAFVRSKVIAKKSSRAALSLVVVMAAILGIRGLSFESSVQEASKDSISATRQVMESVQSESKPVTNNSDANPRKVAKKFLAAPSVRSTELRYAGLDKNGVPTTFSIADSSGNYGAAQLFNRTSTDSESGLLSSQIFKTQSGAANILITQSIAINQDGIDFIPLVSIGRMGFWVPLVTEVTSLESSRLMTGNYLVTAYVAVQSEVVSQIQVPASSGGRDLASIPRQIVCRLVLDESKTKVLAQAVYVVERGVRA